MKWYSNWCYYQILAVAIIGSKIFASQKYFSVWYFCTVQIIIPDNNFNQYGFRVPLDWIDFIILSKWFNTFPWNSQRDKFLWTWKLIVLYVFVVFLFSSWLSMTKIGHLSQQCNTHFQWGSAWYREEQGNIFSLTCLIIYFYMATMRSYRVLMCFKNMTCYFTRTYVLRVVTLVFELFQMTILPF